MSHDDWKFKIRFEIEEVDRLLCSYSLLLNHVTQHTPDLIEITALATVLHSFYNGIEKIFVIIAKEIDGQIPDGTKWHRDLLIQMSKTSDKRTWKITDDTYEKLNAYLGFRHFYRHAYSFQLDWEKLEDLCINISEVWGQIKNEMSELLT